MFRFSWSFFLVPLLWWTDQGRKEEIAFWKRWASDAANRLNSNCQTLYRTLLLLLLLLRSSISHRGGQKWFILSTWFIRLLWNDCRQKLAACQARLNFYFSLHPTYLTRSFILNKRFDDAYTGIKEKWFSSYYFPCIDFWFLRAREWWFEIHCINPSKRLLTGANRRCKLNLVGMKEAISTGLVFLTPD
jgi:hypothetical protein